ncbi:B3 domain-containing transcription factor VRN1 [Linum perenne]
MAEQEDADAGGMWLYKAGVPRFSLVLWSKPFREGKLRLPKGFAKEHGAQLANEVLLKLPNGAEWQVSVVRGRKRIWFVKGWSEFAEFYSLKPTNYLVFGLASTNRLNVIVFDTTATEIDYSNKKVNIKVESECDIESNEALERPSPSSPRARGKSSLKPLKLRRRNITERTASGKGLGDNGKQGRGFKDPGQNRNRTPRGKTSPIPTEGADPLARAKAVFKSENPFFIVVMHPSYIGPGKRLYAPAKFFEKNFTDQCGAIVLQLPDDVRVWRVKYRVGNCGNIKQAIFQSGSWNSFANDNSLRVGDVCGFELVEYCTEPRLNVTIFRASQDGHSHGNTGITIWSS